MPEEQIVRLTETKIDKGHFAVIKNGDCKIEKTKPYIAKSLVYHEAHGIISMRMGMVELQPNEKVPEHCSYAEEIYYVLEGEGTIGIEGTNYEVEKGDIVYKKANVWHGPHVNKGDKPLKLLFVVSQPMKPSGAEDVQFKAD